MRTSCKLCWSVTAAILVLVAGVAATFFVRGNTTASDDGRTAIVLNATERAFVLSEMRGLLEAVEAITKAVAQDDMAAVSTAARAVGMGAVGNEPVTLIAKLPLEFKTLGMTTHQSFDDLALEAEDMGDGMVVLDQLGNILSNCTSCHAGYRFAVGGDG